MTAKNLNKDWQEELERIELELLQAIWQLERQFLGLRQRIDLVLKTVDEGRDSQPE